MQVVFVYSAKSENGLFLNGSLIEWVLELDCFSILTRFRTNKAYRRLAVYTSRRKFLESSGSLRHLTIAKLIKMKVSLAFPSTRCCIETRKIYENDKVCSKLHISVYVDDFWAASDSREQLSNGLQQHEVFEQKYEHDLVSQIESAWSDWRFQVHG